MANEKIMMNDEQMDRITGGTILPHRIKAGESLAEIAKKYHVTEAQLRKWNNIGEESVLKVDQILKIKF